jgi:hypothetical protein
MSEFPHVNEPMNAALVAFLPVEFLPLLITAAGIAWIVGARGLAASLGAAAAAIVVLPALLAPLFAQLPGWLLVAALAITALGLVAGATKALLGKEAWGNMVGILAADVVRALFVGGFKLTAALVALPLRWLGRLLR